MAVTGGAQVQGPNKVHDAATQTANGTILDINSPDGGGHNIAVVQITGTFSNISIAFKVSLDGTNYVAVPFRNVTTGAVATTATATGVYVGSVAGYEKLMCDLTFTSGTSVTVYVNLASHTDINPVLGSTGALATNQAEDAAHTSGDIGALALGVRRDTAASTAGTDADYSALTLDNTGRLWTHVDVITAGETHIGQVTPSAVTKTITPTVSTSPAYTAGDILFDTATITNVARVSGGTAILQSITMIDKADQAAAAIDFYFFSATVTMGAANGTGSLSDADAALCVGKVTLPSANFGNLANNTIGSLTNINLPVSCAATSLFVAAVTNGTPTYGATTDVVLTFGFSDQS